MSGRDYAAIQQRFVTAKQELERSHRALLEAAASYPGTSREWAEATGTNKNSLARLRGAHAVLMASRRGRGCPTLSLHEAVTVANTHNVREVEAICAEMRQGGDPLGHHPSG